VLATQLKGRTVRILYLDPAAALDRPAHVARKGPPGWMVALGVLVYCGLAWTAILTLGAGVWERFAPKSVFAASHRG
jgi:hypothetical protein